MADGSRSCGLFGGADRAIPAGGGRGVRAQALTARASSTRSKVYDGAPHSFFDRRQEQFAGECDDAWRRVLGFAQGAAMTSRSPAL